MVNRIIASLFFIFFGSFLILTRWEVSSAGLPPNTPLAVYPQFFPIILSVFGALLSLSLLLNKIFASGPHDQDIEIPRKHNIYRIIIFNLIICIYLLAFEPLGYLVSTALSLVLFMAFFGLRDIKYYALVIFTIPPVIYYIFKKILFVSFPDGIIGF
jgi:hypothetical protein